MSTRPFVVAHVSDLHVSDFGDSFHDMRHMQKRSARVANIDPLVWEVYWQEAGWRVLHVKGARRSKIQIVDPDGYSHPLPKKKDNLEDVVDRAAQYACRLEARRARSLVTGLSNGALDILAESTPSNVNVRLLRAARQIGDDVDAVVITGDLTDDGEGYELVEAAFSRFKGRLFAVPGNHDRYLFPMKSSARPGPTPEQKNPAGSSSRKRSDCRSTHPARGIANFRIVASSWSVSIHARVGNADFFGTTARSASSSSTICATSRRAPHGSRHVIASCFFIITSCRSRMA